ncbi:MAG: S1 RNA-binding domain-containing protein [Ruminococcus sp.]|nr:S1 RNA-binding domain-containing protein [Ruminococcus sp.]
MGNVKELKVNSIVEGKVSGITKFGAFIELQDGQTGLVHISEVSRNFVNDINDILKIGDTVSAKVISAENGKIALSIKQTQPKPERAPKEKPKRQPYKAAPPVTSPGDYEWQSDYNNEPSSFEDMMSSFKRRSEDKFSDLKRSTGESRGYSRRGHGSKK